LLFRFSFSLLFFMFYFTKSNPSALCKGNRPALGRGLLKVLREVDISIIPDLEFAVAFGTPFPDIGRTHLPSAPRAMDYFQHAPVSGYFPATTMFSTSHFLFPFSSATRRRM
jgi:hypothetical protein